MSVKYVVVEKKKMVIAMLENTTYDAINRINKELYHTGVDVDYYSPKVMMAPKYSGTAKCHGDDSFSVEEGKRIAREKCIRNYNRAMDRRMEHFYNEMQKLSSKLTERYNETCDCDCGNCSDCKCK